MRFQARTQWYAIRVRGVSVSDSKDRERVRQLVDGVDVVLSVLDSRSKESMIVGRGAGILVEVVPRLEPKSRIVHMSSLGIGDL